MEPEGSLVLLLHFVDKEPEVQDYVAARMPPRLWDYLPHQVKDQQSLFITAVILFLLI